MSGLSFSGKTTLARRISEATGSAIVSYDELYAHAPRDEAITGLEEWRLIVGLVHEQARARLAAGESVVVDNLNEDVIDLDSVQSELQDLASWLGLGGCARVGLGRASVGRKHGQSDTSQMRGPVQAGPLLQARRAARSCARSDGWSYGRMNGMRMASWFGTSI
jgi:hypothetical protein